MRVYHLRAHTTVAGSFEVISVDPATPERARIVIFLGEDAENEARWYLATKRWQARLGVPSAEDAPGVPLWYQGEEH